MNNLNVTSNAVYVDTVLSKEVIRAANPMFKLEPTVWRYDQEAKQGGAIDVPLLSNGVANDKIKNLPVSLQSPTEGKITVAIDQHKETSYLIENILQLQGNQDFRKLYTEVAATALAKARDASIAEQASGFSQTKGSYNNAITADVILDSVLLLDLADAPEEDRTFAFHPGVKRDLLDLAVYTSLDYVNGRPTETGKTGNIYGAKTVSTTQIVKSGTSTNNMLYHKQAIILAVAQDIKVRYSDKLEYLGVLLVADEIYGVKEARDTFGVLIKT